MNKHELILKIISIIICLFTLIFLLFLLRAGSPNPFTILFTVYVFIVSLGIYNHHPLALFAWKMLAGILIPATLIAYYGAFDGGPPYPLPGWIMYVQVFGPLIATIGILWILTWSYSKLPVSNR